MGKADHWMLDQPVSNTTIDKKSRFVALIYNVQSRDEVKHLLASVKRDYIGANHYCWAYIIGVSDQPTYCASSDDGEPSGSAGKPILNILLHKRAANCLAVVVRYFGGVKLGVGGLVRAYGHAVNQAVSEATWRLLERKVVCGVAVAFEHEDKARRLCKEYNVEVINATYSQAVYFTLNIPISGYQTFQLDLQSVTAGQSILPVCSSLGRT